jgi:hypothetical protein
MFDVNNLVDNIRNEVETQNKRSNSTVDPRILIFKKGVKYRGRFIPREMGTFVPYEEIGFNSRTNGQYVPLGRAWADPAIKNTGPDIVRKTQWDEYKVAKDRGDEPAMKETYKLIPQRKQYVGFFLTEVDGDDNDAKDKIGTEVAVRYPAGLNKDKTFRSKIAKDINEGLLDPKFKKKIGAKGFLLPDTIEDGIDFIFDIEDKAGYPNYDNSKFDLISDESTVKLTKDQVMEILKNPINLEELVPPLKSQDELKTLLDQHWYGTSASLDDDDLGDTKSSNSLKSLTSGLTDDDDIPMVHSSGKDFDAELDDLLKA